MRIKELANGDVEVKCFGIFSSSKILFDNNNSLLLILKRNWVLQQSSSVVRYSDVDYFGFDSQEYHDSDGDKRRKYKVEINDKEGNIIWDGDTSSAQRYRQVVSLIKGTLKISVGPSSLGKYSENCVACGCEISKVAIHCIYCGEKKTHNQRLQQTQ